MYLFISTEFPSGETVAYKCIYIVLAAPTTLQQKSSAMSSAKMNEAYLLAMSWIDSW